MIDFAIGHFLKTLAEDTHILIAGLEFGRKLWIRLDLTKRSQHKNRGALVDAIQVLQGAKRDTIAHAYIRTESDTVVFISRSRGGPYNATELKFTGNEFDEHVSKTVRAAIQFQDALGASDAELIAFAEACLNIKKS